MVPALVVHCTNEVENRGLAEVGIYRLCGAEKEIRELKVMMMTTMMMMMVVIIIMMMVMVVIITFKKMSRKVMFFVYIY